jgi:hypothetical protein
MILSDWFGTGARGELVPDEIAMPAPKLSPAARRLRYRLKIQNERQAKLHAEQAARERAALREAEMGTREGRRMVNEEDARVAEAGPTPPRPPVELWRVKVLEGFSTQWEGLDYYGPTGSIVDVPRELATAAPHLFERVDASTPLHLVLPTWRRWRGRSWA